MEKPVSPENQVVLLVELVVRAGIRIGIVPHSVTLVELLIVARPGLLQQILSKSNCPLFSVLLLHGTCCRTSYGQAKYFWCLEGS